MGLPIEVASSEYEEHPRGRVVFDRRAERFIIYADQKLQVKAITDDVKALFAIVDRNCLVRSDSHYATGRWSAF